MICLSAALWCGLVVDREVTNPVNNLMAVTDILVSEGRCPPLGEACPDTS